MGGSWGYATHERKPVDALSAHMKSSGTAEIYQQMYLFALFCFDFSLFSKNSRERAASYSQNQKIKSSAVCILGRIIQHEHANLLLEYFTLSKSLKPVLWLSYILTFPLFLPFLGLCFYFYLPFYNSL